MGQLDVLMFLKEQRKNSCRWLSIKEIKEGLIKKGISERSTKDTYKDLQKLAIFNQIDVRISGFWEQSKEFRALRK